ncbi:DUF1064 domain-containing protein [Acinetobacter sp. NigerLNRRAM0016]
MNAKVPEGLRIQSKIKARGRNRRDPKYQNKKTELMGKKFDSIKEAKRYKLLWLMRQEGEIHSLECQVKFVLAESVKFANEDRAKPALRYFADFTYTTKEGLFIVEDVKSVQTRSLAEYRIKKHLMKSVHGIEISEV